MPFLNQHWDVVEELHKPARKKFERRRTVIKDIDDLWQADLVEMISFAKENQHHNYLLTVIDCFSKFAWAIPLKTKSGVEIANAMKYIFLSSKRYPTNLQTDNGKEFYNSSFKRLMKSYRINHYSSYTVLKASIIERFNRTLKEKMWKLFSLNGTYKWINLIKGLICSYNNTYHSTIKMAPASVNSDNAREIFQKSYNYKCISVRGKFCIGDYVRISKFKTIFEKGYTPNWTTEIFKIININNKYPVTYIIQDLQGNNIAGRFYEPELLKVKHPDVYLVEKVLRKRGNNIFVKWLGFNDTFNSWIKKSEVLEKRT